MLAAYTVIWEINSKSLRIGQALIWFQCEVRRNVKLTASTVTDSLVNNVYIVHALCSLTISYYPGISCEVAPLERIVASNAQR